MLRGRWECDHTQASHERETKSLNLCNATTWAAGKMDCGTADALRGSSLERARILFAIALRAELAAEEERVHAAFADGGAQPPIAHIPLLPPLLEVWRELAPPERAANVERLAARSFAFGGTDATATEPFPSYDKPAPTDAAAMLANNFFQRDAQRRMEEAAAGKGLLLPESIGATSCDLVAALVQLLLGAPFAPCGFTADMLLALIPSLRHYATQNMRTTSAAVVPSVTPSVAPAVTGTLDWNAVAGLSERQLRHALRDGLEDDFFYEADELAESCWRHARAARISAVLRALRDQHGSVSLDWLRPMETWAGLRALLALPGMTLPVAASLLLFELQRPLFPVCCNALVELKAYGWVPPHAGATAAFMHLNARLPSDATQLRALYGCLCQQNAFRLTRQAVIGNGKDKTAPADIAYRERRGAYALQLAVQLASISDGPMHLLASSPGGGDPLSDGEAEGNLLPEGTLLIAPSGDSPGIGGPALPLASVVHELLHHHELYPENGCTPLVVALRPVDQRTARATAAALARGALPQQQRLGEGAGLRYVVDVPWSTSELDAAVLLLAAPEGTVEGAGSGSADSGSVEGVSGSADSGTVSGGMSKLAATLAHLGASKGVAAAGHCLFGFGEHLESGLHLSAKCNRAIALNVLLNHVADEEVEGMLDTQGRLPLHAACAAGATEAARVLLARGAGATIADKSFSTPLALAAGSGSLTCVQLMLEHGATPKASSGIAPLETAAGAGARDVVALLLQHGADIDLQDPKTGRTAAHAAARAGQLDVVKFLVDAGASLATRDRTDRLVHEVVPDRLRDEAQWLLVAGKAAAKAKPSKAVAPPPRKDSTESLMATLSM